MEWNDGGWVQGACLTARDGAARLTRHFHGRSLLVWFAGVDARRVILVVGLNRPSELNGSLSNWPSWIPRAGSFRNGQGQDDIVRRFSRRPAGLVFALFLSTLALDLLWQRIDFVPALSRWRFWFTLALASRRRFDFALGHALRLGYQRLGLGGGGSQPCQRVRRRRCPWPGPVQRPRPVALLLVRACQHLRVRGALHPRSRPWQQARDGLGSQVRCPVLTTPPLIPAGPPSCGSGGFQGSGRRASVVRRSMAAPSPHGQSGGSQRSGQMSVARHSEAAPSPGAFSHAGVSDGDGKGEGENDEDRGAGRAACSSLPAHGM